MSSPTKDKLFFLNEVENAINSLKVTAQFSITVDSFKWKWITIALHHSLYSFCIACQAQGNPDNVFPSGDDDNDYYVKKEMMSNSENQSKYLLIMALHIELNGK